MTQQRDPFSRLPAEILNMITPLVPRQDLRALRSSCRSLNDLFTPYLFRLIKITFAERHIQRLEGVSSSAKVACWVRELMFFTPQTRDTHDVPGGIIHTDAAHRQHASDYRRRFFACVDSLPNLHTFISELGPVSAFTDKEDIDGLVYAILPALCRTSSRIKTLRCQDVTNYIAWFKCKSQPRRGHPRWPKCKSYPTMCSSSDNFGPPWHYGTKRACTRYPWNMGPWISSGIHPTYTLPYEWTKALRNLVKLDLHTDSVGKGWECSAGVGETLVWFLQSAVNLQEMSIRWRRTEGGSNSSSSSNVPGRPPVHSGWMPEHILNGHWPHLKTIKLTFLQLTFNGRPLQEFIARHAATLRHIMIHCCAGDRELVRVVHFAARSPNVKLHKFTIFPADKNHQSGQNPIIIEEREVLEYINSKDPLHTNPFGAWIPLGANYWGTVDKKAESLRFKWPENNGLDFTCRLCEA